MALPTEGVTRWFRDDNGKISQINNVLEIVFATPLIAKGYYRDEPSIVVGGASGATFDALSAQQVAASIAGGVNPTASAAVISGNIYLVKAEGASSILQSDAFAHVDLRFVWSPTPMIFFRTYNGPPHTSPTSSTFAIARPSGVGADFDAFNLDCAFAVGEDWAIFNSPPPGWSPGESGEST